MHYLHNRSKDKTTNDNINSTCETDQLTIQPSTSETVNIGNEICLIYEPTQTVVSPLSILELQGNNDNNYVIYN